MLWLMAAENALQRRPAGGIPTSSVWPASSKQNRCNYRGRRESRANSSVLTPDAGSPRGASVQGGKPLVTVAVKTTSPSAQVDGIPPLVSCTGEKVARTPGNQAVQGKLLSEKEWDGRSMARPHGG